MDKGPEVSERHQGKVEYCSADSNLTSDVSPEESTARVKGTYLEPGSTTKVVKARTRGTRGEGAVQSGYNSDDGYED